MIFFLESSVEMKRHVVDFIEFLDGRALSYHIKMKNQNG